MDTEVNEKIKVWAFFDPSTDSTSSLQASSGQASIFPIAILWRRRLIKLEKLVFASSRKDGLTKLVDLICAGEGANYVLEYNTATYNWKLKKVMGKE